MSRPRGTGRPSAGPSSAGRRSGDPRKRAAEPSPPVTGAGRRLASYGLSAAATVAILAFLALRPSAEQADDAARAHAGVACDLTTKAEEAAQVDTGARFAAAVLLLDSAIVESARAARSDPGFAGLDRAVQAVHTAGHAGDPDRWQSALEAALGACRTSLG